MQSTSTKQTGFTKQDIEDLNYVDPNMPRLVTRGAHIAQPTPHPQKTSIDTITITAQDHFILYLDLIKLSIHDDMDSNEIAFVPQKKGLNGYTYAYKVIYYGQTIAIVCHGATNENQAKRPMLHIDGHGCSCINWSKFYHYLNFLRDPRITRIDINFDTFDGSQTIEKAKEDHLNGKFTSSKSNCLPKITPYGDIQPDGQNFGRTLCIGSQKSSKFIRIYEKGYEYFKPELVSEQLSKQCLIETKDGGDFIPDDNLYRIYSAFRGETGDKQIDDDHLNNGQSFDPRKWIRAEIQMRNGDREIPLDAIIDRDDYFSGAYPYCKELLMNDTSKITNRKINIPALELERRIENMKPITGSLIDDLLVLGWTNEQIIKRLRGGKGPSQKIIQSGLLHKNRPDYFDQHMEFGKPN